MIKLCQFGFECADRIAYRAFILLELFQLSGSANDLWILSGIGCCSACLYPCFERLFCRCSFRLGLSLLDTQKIKPVADRCAIIIDSTHLAAKLNNFRCLNEIATLNTGFDLRKIANDQIAETDQKCGEHNRNEPKDALIEPFGDPNSLHHIHLIDPFQTPTLP